MMSLEILDFDNIDDWASGLETALHPLMTSSARKKLAEAKLVYVEDTRNLLFKLANRNAIIDAVLTWLCSIKIAGYHGTRLIDSEITSIQVEGLLPLNSVSRRNRLTRAMSQHPRWNDVADQLDEIIQALGKGNREGRREGQVHLTLSRAGLVYGFNHYLLYGSEFDQHVAQKLLGNDGMKLLSLDGKPKVIKIAIPGDLALKAAHPFFSVDNLRVKGDVPNIVNELLMSWSYRVSNPNFGSVHHRGYKKSMRGRLY